MPIPRPSRPWKRSALRGLLFLTAALVTPFLTAAQTPSSVDVLVTTSSGRPLADAEVRLGTTGREDLATATNGQGRARLGGLQAGTWTLRVSALGYRTSEQQVTIGPSSSVLTVRLAEAPLAVQGLVVEAARTSAPASTLPAAVSVVGRETLGLQTSVSTGLNGGLAKVVPGLSAGTGSASMFGQSFRGRNVAVLIDGVPQSTSRNVLRDLATLDPSVVERVEVLRGATALYGDGATGGVINIITRTPRQLVRYETAVSVEAAPADVGEGSGVVVEQSVEGRRGAFDWLLSGSWSTVGAFFDGEGDRTPPDPQGQGGLADYAAASFLGKLGYSSGDRRAELSVQRYDGTQNTTWTTDPSVNASPPGDAKALAVDGLDIDGVTGTDNLNVVASFRDDAVVGGSLRARAYFRDYLTVFGPFDGRSYLNHVAQSFVDSRKLGGRVEHEVSFDVPGSPELVWGLDLTHERSFQGLNLMDGAAYDASGGRVFRKVGEARWVPAIDNRSLGAFAQVGWNPTGRVSVRGGIRHEQARVQVEDFTTVTGNAVTGGQLDYDPVLLNLGAVIRATGTLDLFASWAQGFSLADIGRVLRGAPAGFSLGSRDLEAQMVDHYEVGARAEMGPLHASASVFRSDSDLGTNFTATLDVVRAPERIRGFEAAVDVRLWAGGSAGGSFTWSEGESLVEATGDWIALNGFRIQPAKTTLYLEHRAPAGWSTRIQLLSSANRDRAFEDGLTYGHLPIEAYTLVDWVGSLEVGPGRVDVGVQNVFDAQYFPIVSQLYTQWGNSSRAAGRGRTVGVGYRLTW